MANTVLNSTWTFAGSINCKWLALTAFTGRKREREGEGGCYKQRAGCHMEGRRADWLVLTEGQLWSLTSLHCLDSTPCVYNTTTEEREGKTLSLNNLNQASCFFKGLFVLLLLCWHSSLIILPRLDSMMKCQAWWCRAALHSAYDVHMQRTKAVMQDWRLLELYLNCAIKFQFSERWDSPDSYLILRL